jgi:chloramphenicol-sensitive protein RarD
MVAEPTTRASASGVVAAFAASLIWGINPVYFKAVLDVPPLEILAHRICWSVPLMTLVVVASGRTSRLVAAVHSLRAMFALLASTVAIAVNWLTYIWSVNSGRVLEASLGYFVSPLVFVLFGVLFFGERLRPWQWSALLLAGAGVVVLFGQSEGLPWISITLALTVTCYGSVRKAIDLDARVGLLIETALLLVPALAYLVLRAGPSAFRLEQAALVKDILLVCAGPVTAIPLVLFTFAAPRVSLSSLGLIQYVSPTLQFLLAVALYGETFTQRRGIAFGLIWIGLVIYTVDVLRSRRGGSTKAVG